MAYINLSIDTKLDRLNTLNNDIGGNASVVIYDGTYPQTPDFPASANALVTFPCNSQAFGNVSIQTVMVSTTNVVTNTISISNINVATLVSIQFPPQLATGNGIAGWARITNANGNAIVDLDVGTAGTSVIMNNTDLVAGIPVQVVTITISEQ